MVSMLCVMTAQATVFLHCVPGEPMQRSLLRQAKKALPGRESLRWCSCLGQCEHLEVADADLHLEGIQPDLAGVKVAVICSFCHESAIE